MDVMTPEVYWIDNRCYRRNPGKTSLSSVSTQKFWSSKDKPGPETSNSAKIRGDRWPTEPAPATIPNNGSDSDVSPLKPYVEEDADYSYLGDPTDSEDDGYVIEPSGRNNGYRTKCDNIPSQLFAVVIGSKGSTKARIERDSGTRITVPRPNVKGWIEIEGRTVKGVKNARRTIDLLTSQTRNRNDATHFPCFPLNSPVLVERVKAFKEALTARGIDPDFFINGEKAHLTICVVVLFNEDERRKVGEIVENSYKEIAEQLGHKGKVTASIKGLEIMNDDQTQADILYAKCSEVGGGSVLQQTADFVGKKLAAAGYFKGNRTDHVKLHCTIMTSLKKAERAAEANEIDDNHGGGRNNYRSKLSRPKFDASMILKDFKDYDFGLVDINEIKLATRFTSGPDGFYKSYRSIPL